MNDFVMGASIFCMILSSMRLGTMGYDRVLKATRSSDNTALVAKIVATPLASVVAIVAMRPLFLVPLCLYCASTYFFYVKTKMKGKPFVWGKPYEMKSWDQEAINTSAVGYGSALCTLAANISMVGFAFLLHEGSI